MMPTQTLCKRVCIRPSSWCVLAVATVLSCGAVRTALSSTKAIVKISADVGSRQSVGTGFFVLSGETPLIITCYHVVEGARTIRVFDLDNRKITVGVGSIAPGHDLAVLTVPQGYRPPAAFDLHAHPGTMRAGDNVKVFGHPVGIRNLQFTGTATRDGFLTSTQISGLEGERVFNNDINVLPIDVTIARGMSGGPVLWKGKVVGVMSGSLNPGVARTIAWAIPTSYIDSDYLRPYGGTWPKLSLMSADWVKISLRAPETDKPETKKAYLYVRQVGGNWRKIGPLPVTDIISTEATYATKGFITYVAEIKNDRHTPPPIPRD